MVGVNIFGPAHRKILAIVFEQLMDHCQTQSASNPYLGGHISKREGNITNKLTFSLKLINLTFDNGAIFLKK